MREPHDPIQAQLIEATVGDRWVQTGTGQDDFASFCDLDTVLKGTRLEGGALRFREYGEQLYEVERGTAVVWSASLLHEVLPVTKGRRFVLGVHMFAP